MEEVKVKIDLAAERLIAAERGEEKIAVEIKRFISPSPISDFHTALGQFLNYKIMLEVKDPHPAALPRHSPGYLRQLLPQPLCPNRD